MHVIVISAPAPNAYINLWTSIIKYSALNAKCNGQHSKIHISAFCLSRHAIGPAKVSRVPPWPSRRRIVLIKGSLSSSWMNSPIPSLLLPLWQKESVRNYW